MFEKLYPQLANILPRSALKYLEDMLTLGGFKSINPRSFAGFLILLSTVTFVSTWIIARPMVQNSFSEVLIALTTTGIILFAVYILILVAIDAKAHEIEQMLPNALQIISANIKAGMTLENAIWSSARPEFGKLSEEIQLVAADTFTGKPITTSLKNMNKRVRSKILERAVNLIAQGIALGGSVGKLLEEVAEDIRSQKQIETEIITATRTYTLFLIFAAVLAAPALFGGSVYYIETNERLFQSTMGNVDFSSMPKTATTGLFTPGAGGAAGITSQDVNLFALILINATNFLAALTLGIIENGNALKGIKYIAPFLIVSNMIFFAVLSFLRATFATFI